MAKTVTVIQPTLTQFSSKPISVNAHRRVAAYARVSTDKDEQFTSYAAQVEYYKKYIQNHKDWDFVEVYSDEGISGTSRKHREGFNRMISDALSGKIDLIVTKSVSRFARNTVDSLTAIRELKDKGVECFFEKENIWTFDSQGEVVITIMSSIAQEESRSISDNIKWAYRNKFAKGDFSLPYKHFLGYDRGEDGKPKKNPEEAKIIERIFSDFLAGKSPYTIADELTAMGIETPKGNKKWSVQTIQSILRNEKYAGDALLMKTYSTDFLTKTRKKNNGEVRMYDVKDSHEAIISHEVFDMVQHELEIRGSAIGKPYSSDIFAGKVICGDCGHAYGAKVWHSTDKYRKVIYQCNHKFSNGEKCTTPHLSENEIKKAFVDAVNELLTDKSEIIDNIKKTAHRVGDTTELEKEQVKLETEIEVIAQMLRQSISSGPISEKDISTGKYSALSQQYRDANSKLENIKKEISDKKNRSSEIKNFIKILQNNDSVISEFSEDLWAAMIDHITVFSKEKIIVVFKCGTDITVSC